ncbi:uncharacterized protein LOC141861082 [Acropora palmata]|uniref:uncharacterized protein LOC141861082 n=1 Tax=Acropora palmata TaxID=6131 RepID=UPI003DA09583
MSAGKSLLDENDDENKLLSEIEEENTTSADKGDPWSAIHDMQKSITAMAESIHEIYKQNAESKAPSTAQQSVPSQKRKTTADVSQAASKKKKADCNSTGNANTDNGNESDPDLIEILGTESKESDDDEELLEEIEQTGPDVNKNLANIINKRYTGKLTENKLKEKLELYARPGNCEKLKAPEFNHEIWGKLKTPQKTRDLRMANVRKTVIKATVAVAEVTNELLQKKSSADIIRKLTDSIALMGHATYELSLRRRDLMRPSINKELRSLCNQQIPVTDQLFVNDVQNSLKTIKECNKIANNCTQAQGSEHKRYNNGYKPFLGHRKDHGYKYNKKKPWYNKGKKENPQ